MRPLFRFCHVFFVYNSKKTCWNTYIKVKGGGKTMDIEGFKKLVKKYGLLHAAFVNEALTGGRYYRNGSDILFGYEKEDTGDNTP